MFLKKLRGRSKARPWPERQRHVRAELWDKRDLTKEPTQLFAGLMMEGGMRKRSAGTLVPTRLPNGYDEGEMTKVPNGC